jgi:hypothetical protein
MMMRKDMPSEIGRRITVSKRNMLAAYVAVISITRLFVEGSWINTAVTHPPEVFLLAPHDQQGRKSLCCPTLSSCSCRDYWQLIKLAVNQNRSGFLVVSVVVFLRGKRSVLANSDATSGETFTSDAMAVTRQTSPENGTLFDLEEVLVDRAGLLELQPNP